MSSNPGSSPAARDATGNEPLESGPSKGLYAVARMSSDQRLRGRPKLCSDCGLCDSHLRPRMPALCLFVDNRAQALERTLHGRNRGSGDELLFGIFAEQLIARLRAPLANAQWSGIVSRLAARLLERGDVEAVLLTGTQPGTRFAPRPVLATQPSEVFACAGNKPCLSPVIGLLDAVRDAGVKRLAAVGTGCQVQMLRQAEPELGLERLDLIGIPCSDNVTYEDQQFFLTQVSRSPETIVHYEFMQDYSLWMRHEDGRIERLSFIDFPMDRLESIFPSACLSCFDYPNALSDVTIGYMGAPLGWQWLLARTPRGQALLELLRPDLETREASESGDRTRGMPRFIRSLAQRPARPPWLVRRLVSRLQRSRGPKGLEFARAIIEMKLLRNLTHVRNRFPSLESRVVPWYVYRAVARYAGEYTDVFGQAPSPPTSDARAAEITAER